MKDKLLRQLPIALVVITAGIGIAQSATTGRVFPYVGYLEENGFPVTGERDMRINLYSSSGAGTACQTEYFDGVTVAGGRFKIDVEDVVDNCLITGELYASIAVGEVGGTLTDLSTGEGTGRVMIGAVPFAAASPKAATLLVESDADIGGALVVGGAASVGGALDVGGTTDIGTNRILLNDGSADHELSGQATASNATGVELRVLTNPASGEPIFRVLSSGGAERLRVEHDGETVVGGGNDLRAEADAFIDGSATIGANANVTGNAVVTGSVTAASVSSSGDVDVGGQLNLTDISGTCMRLGTMQFCSATSVHDSGTGNHNVTWPEKFGNTTYTVVCNPDNTDNAAYMVVIRSKSTTGAALTVFTEAENKSARVAACIAYGTAGNTW